MKKQEKTLKDVLSKEEYKKVKDQNIEITIGALKQEGYVDNGKLRKLLKKVHNGELTYEEARAIILNKANESK